jgi:hypothetical protein
MIFLSIKNMQTHRRRSGRQRDDPRHLRNVGRTSRTGDSQIKPKNTPV